MDQFSKIAEGIYSFRHQVADGNNGIIFTQAGAVAIDVGTHAEEGQVMADFIRAHGYQPDLVILTHGHSDHVLGGETFRGAQVYASQQTPDEMVAALGRYAAAKNLSLDALMEQALHPTVTFSDTLWLHRGERVFQLFPTPGHSADHVSVYLPGERILFAADAVVTSIIPAIFHDSRVFEETLTKIAAMDIEILIPGHGEALYGSAQISEWLTWMRRYLQLVRVYVRKAMNHVPVAEPEQIAREADFDTFVEGHLPVDRFNMVQRHRNTVIKICQEEQSTQAIQPR